MLYIAWMVILTGHNIKKTSFESSIFELPKVKNSISTLCTNPLGDPCPAHGIPELGKKHVNTAYNML